MLGLVDSLKAIVEDIGARAEKLTEDLNGTTAREGRRHETSLEEQARQQSAAILKAEGGFQEALAGAQVAFEKRKVRIGRAYQGAREAALKKIDERVGARKYELQKAMLQAEKDRDTALTAAAAASRELQANVATEQGKLADLERSAQQSFKGYGGFRRLFLAAYQSVQVNTSGDAQRLLTALRDHIEKANVEHTRLRGFLFLRFFKHVWLWLVLTGSLLVLVPLGVRFAGQTLTYAQAAATAGGLFILILVLRLMVQRAARPTVEALSRVLAQGRHLYDAADHAARTESQQTIERINSEYAQKTRAADESLKQAQAAASNERVSCRMATDERTVALNARHEQLFRLRRDRLEKDRARTLRELKESAEARTEAQSKSWAERQIALKSNQAAALEHLEQEWKTKLEPIYGEIRSVQALAEQLFPAWSSSALGNWSPPATFSQAARFGRGEVDVSELCEVLPRHPGLALPGPTRFSVPLCLAYPDQGSILLETGESNHDQAVGLLNNLMLRLLCTAPPGRLNFTILDPVGLGQNFAGVMHLADYEEQMINHRIWTQSGQIEEKLADLNEHMEKVIQMYLRNEYQTIAEYNEQAGVIAEKYYFLVIADFPAGFTDTAAKRLLSIAASGARCGVYTLIHWDRRLPVPQDFIPDDLRKSSVNLAFQDMLREQGARQKPGNPARGITASGQEAKAPEAGAGEFQASAVTIDGKRRPGVEILLEQPPGPEASTELIQRIGRLSRDSSRVEVPFEQVAPPEEQIWSEDTSSELRVAIGRTGATKLQYLAIGKGTRQHGLVAGKTGSGKSTLFHVIITNLALWCSPEQVEFYLVDFKKGVEFKCYGARRLPHARVVAIESDREFGLSVLQRVDDELRRRGDLFRALGVQDVAGYKKAGGTEAVPRTLLLIDEFQEFFVEDDKVSQTASLLLDRIVRQGRAFGIHVLLGSQTLGGAYTVARTTLGQMVIRIALQCNEADAYLIMDDTNPAPRLLSRPGEGIYNDMAGALEGNSPFQVVWLPDEVRDQYLVRVRARADGGGVPYPGPIVFEGNAPADVRANDLLRQLLESPSVRPSRVARIWLGAPNSIKGPTEAAFHRQTGNNLLIVGQREEATLAMFCTGLIALAAQFPLGAARFILCDATPPGTPHREYLEKVLQAIPHPVTRAKPGDLPELMKELASEAALRAEQHDPEAAPPIFLLIHGLQRFARLRYEDDFGLSSSATDSQANPGAVLNDLVCERTRLGFHVIASCDTYNNLNRFLSRKAISEFEMKVLFQMSANDSASLIDSPKAGALGLHRAILFNAQEGYLETFRPYALPEPEWLEQVARSLRRLLPSESNRTAANR